MFKRFAERVHAEYTKTLARLGATLRDTTAKKQRDIIKYAGASIQAAMGVAVAAVQAANKEIWRRDPSLETRGGWMLRDDEEEDDSAERGSGGDGKEKGEGGDRECRQAGEEGGSRGGGGGDTHEPPLPILFLLVKRRGIRDMDHLGSPYPDSRQPQPSSNREQTQMRYVRRGLF